MKYFCAPGKRACLCLAVILLFFLGSSAKASIPVLRDGAKHSPHGTAKASHRVAKIKSTGKHTGKSSRKAARKKSKSQSRLAAARPFPVLGSRGNISAVKTRPSSRARICRNSRFSAPVRGSLHRRISAKSAIIIDAETGKTIFAKSPDVPRQPASTIKILTGLIALKSLKENSLVSVSRRAARMPRSKIYIDPRKKYRADDLINAVLLASANDASVALAEEIAGSEREFAKIMTLRAKLWGAKNTVCKTANGLTARGQHTTARDLAVIFRHVMQDKDFAKRMAQTKAKTSYGKLLRNHNKALWRIKGALGGKTGYTAAAGQTYVGKFTNGKNSIIVAIMGSDRMWQDIKKLVDYGFRQQSKIQLASSQ